MDGETPHSGRVRPALPVLTTAQELLEQNCGQLFMNKLYLDPERHLDLGGRISYMGRDVYHERFT